MRGLPHPPQNVWQIRQSINIEDSTSSIGFYVYNPGALGPLPGDLAAFAGLFFLNCSAALLSCLGDDATLGVFRLRAWGSAPVTYETTWPLTHGSQSGGSAPLTSASCLSWTTALPGRGVPRTLFPLANSFILSDRRLISAAGAGTLEEAADNLIAGVHAIPGLDGTPCTLGTVSRVLDGIPRGVATFELFLGGVADRWVATCDRRLQRYR